MTNQRAYSALLLLSLTVYCSADSLTPLIAWSNGNVLTSSQPSTVHELLQDANLDQVNVAVVFKAPKLTFDDLAKFSGAFGEKNAALNSLQAELQSSASQQWSGLSGQPASSVINSLAFTMDVNPRYIKVGDDLNLNKDGRTVLVVSLPSGEGEVGFALQGDTISQVMVNLKTLAPDATFLALYTSDYSTSSFTYSSDYVSDNDDAKFYQEEIHNGATVLRIHRNRQVRQSGGDPRPDVERGDTVCAQISDGGETACAVLCLTDDIIKRVNVTIEKRRKKDNDRAEPERLTNFAFFEGNCDVNNSMYGSPYIKARANLNSTTDEIMLSFVFRQCTNDCPLRKTYNLSSDEERPNDIVRKTVLRRGYWRLDLYVKEPGEEEVLFLRSPEGPRIFTQFEIPVGASYACGKNKLNHYELPKTPEVEGDTFIQYRFNGLQAQVNVQRGPEGREFFASAYNCQGYFSNMTWMGIFAVLITIFFLYVANVFSFSIETIDRFDDPRGPTITVENLH